MLPSVLDLKFFHKNFLGVFKDNLVIENDFRGVRVSNQ